MSSEVIDVPKSEKSPTATKGVEAWFEYAKNHLEVLETGHRAIYDADDPRWDTEIKDEFKGDPHGRLRVSEVTRVDGEVVRIRDILGSPCHPNKARSYLRKYKETGEILQERHHRDNLKAMEEAKREGRAEDLAAIYNLLKNAAKAPTASDKVGN